MPELEITAVLTEIVNFLNEIGPLPEQVVVPLLSRIEDVLNHLNAHYLQFKAETDALKIRVEKLESIKRKS